MTGRGKKTRIFETRFTHSCPTLSVNTQTEAFVCPSVVTERLIHTREIGVFGPKGSEIYDM